MPAFVIVALGVWAFGGVFARVKQWGMFSPAASAAAGAPAAPGIGPTDVTFGHWRRAAFGRWKTRLRAAMPGTHKGDRVRDLFADAAAHGLAGAGVFAAGFVSGAGWLAGKLVERRAAERLRARRADTGPSSATGGTPRTGSTYSGRRFPGGTSRPTTGPRSSGPRSSGPGAPGPGPRRPYGTTPPPPWARTEPEIFDGELVGDPPAPPGKPRRTPPGDIVDAEIVDTPDPASPPARPQLTARPTAPNGAVVPEILTIHQLFAWCRTVIAGARNTADQSTIRANAAMQRADSAVARSLHAGLRADEASAVAVGASGHAALLDATAARFSVLNMDAASMTAINIAIQAAAALASAEHRRADAEVTAAAAAVALADAEAEAARAAEVSARAAEMYMVAVQAMHDTVQIHQAPHAEAQAATGNAAAHASVLGAS